MFTELFPKKIPQKHRPITISDIPEVIKKEGPISLQNKIIVIDFKTTPSFTDPYTTDFCLVVTTSNGKKGTLTHLQIDADIPEFADNLLQVHDGTPTSACLSGATSNGEKLLADTIRELSSRKFIVSTEPQHSCTGGILIYRETTLFPDKVHVLIKPYQNKDTSTTLMFPKTPSPDTFHQPL